MTDNTDNTNTPDPNKAILRAHSFDGIQEYDNVLPMWMLYIFYISIAWSGWYFYNYHFGDGAVGPRDLYAQQALNKPAEVAILSEDELRALSTQDDIIAMGKEEYTGKGCIACHGADASGSVGPNLLDDFWKYGSNMTDIVDTIANGRVPAAGGAAMPAHKGKISPKRINATAAFLVSINRATTKTDGKAPTGKAPEGEKQPITY